MHRLIRVNAGGRRFEALASTLTKYNTSVIAGVAMHHLNTLEQHAPPPPPPGAAAKGGKGKGAKKAQGMARREAAAVADALQGHPISALCCTTGDAELFIDLNPQVFEVILDFLRTGRIGLPTDNDPLRAAIVHQLDLWGLTDAAFPPVPVDEQPSDDAAAKLVALPDVLVVQCFDHMQHEQGVKRHAMTITFGSDGFRLKNMCKTIRADLNTQLAASYWQIYQTNERSAFFVCTRISNGSADLLLTSVSQRVISHAEAMGYSIQSSYVTLSPDVVHTNVRMFIHNFIFRRVRQPVLEASDELMEMEEDHGELGELAEGEDGALGAVRGRSDEDDDVLYRNFEPPRLGPQMGAGKEAVAPPSQRVGKIWD
jgi:hypothetical protein